MEIVIMIDYDTIWQVSQTIEDFFDISDLIKVFIENEDTKFIMQCFGDLFQPRTFATNK